MFDTNRDGRVTLKEAAMRAGYKEGSASVMAWKLTNPKEYPQKAGVADPRYPIVPAVPSAISASTATSKRRL